ncbi:MAG: hypothetical protein ACXWKU_22205 [Caulobacteraceae bacterium]
MNLLRIGCAALALTVLPAAASAQAQGPAMAATPVNAPGPAAAPKPGVRTLKLTNSGGGITAIYAAPAGSSDMSDDLLGSQTAGSGRTVTLKVNDDKAACVFDLQFLMSDGKLVTRKAVDLCQTQAYTFTP